MKITIYLLSVLLVAALGAAAFFYFQMFEPMLADYNRMKAGMPELDRAKGELKKYREKEARETGWTKPVADALTAGLAGEIQAGKAEVAVAGNGIVVNISEGVLYTPQSVTFAGKETLGVLQRLASSLSGKDVKGKSIIVGNTTDSVPARGRGRKRTPPREGRALASDRSLALVKYLQQNKVEEEALVAGGYAAKLSDKGFRIKDHKTIIVITNAPAPAPTQPAAAGASQQVPKTIPIKPAEPRGQ